MSLGLAALIAWLLTAGIGGYMLRTWVVRGGPHRRRATGAGVPPGMVFSHAAAALTGLAVWVGYLGSGWRPLAWIGVALVCTAITLGICTVTLWTPYPVRPDPEAEEAPAPGRPAGRPPGPAGGHHDPFTVTDEMIASLLAEPVPASRPRKPHLLSLIPATHGFTALATFLLTTMSALSPR